MKYKLWIFLLCQVMLIIFITCCATNPEQIEQADNDSNITAEKPVNRTPGSSITMDNFVTKVNINYPFDPVEFVQSLNESMEVVRVFPDPNIDTWIGLPGQSAAGRQYFNYISPLYSRPISSSDEMIAMVYHQTRIARQLNPGYIVNLDIDIRNAEAKELERKTITLNVQYGTKIQDYRREGMIRYTLKDANGTFRYGAYVVTSAIVTQNNTEAETFNALQEWMEQAEKAEIIEILEKLFRK
ncbi:MAG: hypothetical protein FWD26_07880 [Treponema sp.]|nr:hypothetical protein [Treponema sp.]